MNDVGQLIRDANPIQGDPSLLADDEFEALLFLARTRSGNVDAKELTKPIEPEKKQRNGWLVAAVAFAVVILSVGAVMLLASPADELPPATTPATTQAVTPTTTGDPTKPTVEVDGARLAYNCWGTGSPTVVVELGLNAGVGRSDTWYGWDKALAGIAETNKVCIYGRRGVAESRSPDADVTTQEQSDDLVQVIAALDLDTPLVLVGHSIAGYNLRVFADQNPDDVLGLVFVDASEPSMQEHESVGSGVMPERLDVDGSGELVSAVTDLGDLPVQVLTGMRAPDWWLESQQILVGLSTNSLQIEVDSGHSIFATNPQTVIDAVAWVVSQSE